MRLVLIAALFGAPVLAAEPSAVYEVQSEAKDGVTFWRGVVQDEDGQPKELVWSTEGSAEWRPDLKCDVCTFKGGTLDNPVCENCQIVLK